MSLLLLLYILMNYMHYCIDACDDNFVPCGQGIEGSICTTDEDTIIAYGIGDKWTYYQKIGGQNIDCTDSVFGDPDSFNPNPKECCKLTKDLSGSSGLSLVVNTILLNQTIYHFFKAGGDDHPSQYWKLTISLSASVTFDNCASDMDTRMWVRDSTGNQISTSVCDGDDCGNCFTPINRREKFTLSLTPGDYYIELNRYLTTVSGNYVLTVSAVYPTMNPSKYPTENPTMNRYPKTSCGSNYCYYVDLFPIIGSKITNTVSIFNEDETTEKRFEVHYTVHDNYCHNPSISFTFEEIDFDASFEYIDLIDNNGSLITKCTGTQEKGCGNWLNCLSSYSLGTNKITADSNYTITIVTPPGINALCTSSHPYELNARLTIFCLGDTKAPTTDPVFEPTLHPTTTFHPSDNPTSSPIIDPTAYPTFHPSDNPSDNPTTNPILMDPTAQPTVQPSTGSPITFVSTTSVHVSNTAQPTYKPTNTSSPTTSSSGSDKEQNDGTTLAAVDSYDGSNDIYNNVKVDIILLIIIVTWIVSCCIVLYLCLCWKKRRKVNNVGLRTTEAMTNHVVEITTVQKHNDPQDGIIASSNGTDIRSLNHVTDEDIMASFQLQTDIGVNDHNIGKLVLVNDENKLNTTNGANDDHGFIVNGDSDNEDVASGANGNHEFIVNGDSDNEDVMSPGQDNNGVIQGECNSTIEGI